MLNAIQGVSYGQNAYVSVYASRRVAAQTGAVRPAQPDMPVQAVEPVRSVPRTEEVTEHPDALRRWSSDPVSMAVRSRMGIRNGVSLSHAIGVIGRDYRGPLGAGLHNLSQTPYTVQPGDRVAQLMVVPVIREQIEVVEELPPTRRGSGGFGSTGR